MSTPLDQLTRREREIVNVVFGVGNRATVEDIRSRLRSPPSDSSVRVMLARLQKKGVIKRLSEGTRNVYAVTTSPASAKRHVLRDYLQTFFAGSPRRLLMSLLRQGSWSHDDLQALRELINKLDKERKQ